MTYFYPNLELAYGQKIVGHLPYPQPQKMKNGNYRITFQSGSKRYNIYLTDAQADGIANDPPGPNEAIEIKGELKGLTIRKIRAKSKAAL